VHDLLDLLAYLLVTEPFAVATVVLLLVLALVLTVRRRG
jgi:hypothetical protein